jgi:hypothetical protein
VFPSTIRANGGSDAPIGFDILHGNELANSAHVPGVHYLFDVTPDDEFVLVTCHIAEIHAERDIDGIFP